MSEKLASEFIAAANGDGNAIKKKRILIGWLMQIKLLPIFDDNV